MKGGFHHDGDQLEGLIYDLKKGKLNLQGVLLGMSFGKEPDLLPSLLHLFGNLRINRNHTEWGPVTSPVIDGSPLERNPMTGGNHNNSIVTHSLDQLIGMG